MIHAIAYIIGSLIVCCVVSGCDMESTTTDQARPDSQMQTQRSAMAKDGPFEIRSAGPDAVFDTADDLTDTESRIHREQVEARDQVNRQAELEKKGALAAQEHKVLAYGTEAERRFQVRLAPIRDAAAEETSRKLSREEYFRSDDYKKLVQENRELRKKYPELGPYVPWHEPPGESPYSDLLAEVESQGPQPVSFGDPGWSLNIGRIGYITRARVVQIVDSTTLIVRTAGKTVVVKGLGTGKLVDGDTLRPYMMEVAGRTTYRTALGAKATVYLLEPFDIEPFRKMVPPSALRD